MLDRSTTTAWFIFDFLCQYQFDISKVKVLFAIFFKIAIGKEILFIIFQYTQVTIKTNNKSIKDGDLNRRPLAQQAVMETTIACRSPYYLQKYQRDDNMSVVKSCSALMSYKFEDKTKATYLASFV